MELPAECCKQVQQLHLEKTGCDASRACRYKWEALELPLVKFSFG